MEVSHKHIIPPRLLPAPFSALISSAQPQLNWL